MTTDEFIDAFEEYLTALTHAHAMKSPYKTGNLRYNAIKVEKTENGFRVYVDLDKAEYAKWLDDKPKIQMEHPEGWWREIATAIIEDLINQFDGETLS